MDWKTWLTTSGSDNQRLLIAKAPEYQADIDTILERVAFEPSCGCWLWLGSRLNSGYGQIRINGRALILHRFIYDVCVSPVHDHMVVCHRCDTPECVNPDHLFLGTHEDNMRDMARKGRAAKGKLTADQVREIRELEMPEDWYAQKFRVSRQVIYNVLAKKTYKWVI